MDEPRDALDPAEETPEQRAGGAGEGQGSEPEMQSREEKEKIKQVNHCLTEGMKAMEEKKFDRALAFCDRALSLAADSPVCYDCRATVRNASGDWQGAVEDLTAAISLAPEEHIYLLYRGHVYMNHGAYRSAVEDYHRARSLGAEGVEIHDALTFSHYMLEEYGEALIHCDAAIALDANNPVHHQRRGMILRKTRQLAAALLSFNRFLARDPGDADGLCVRGDTHLELGDLPAALKDFNRALDIRPYYAYALYRRGYAYHLMGKARKAQRDRKNAQLLWPDYPMFQTGYETLARRGI